MVDIPALDLSDGVIEELFNLAQQPSVPSVQLQRTRTVDERQPVENPELRWLRDHPEEVARYRGQWLLIMEDSLLAHNATFSEIRDLIARQQIRSPFVYYVPAEDESEFVIL